QDTGLAGHRGTLGWRGLDNHTDTWGVAAPGGSSGLNVWYGEPFDVMLISDQGQAYPSPSVVSTGAPYSRIAGCSTMRVDASGKCITGSYPISALNGGVSQGVAVATPYSMAGIAPGVTIVVDGGLGATVTAVTSTTFTASFPEAYADGTSIEVFGGVLFSIDETALATQISQNLGLDVPKAVAAHPTDATFAACVTGRQFASPPDQRAWIASGGGPLDPMTVWQEITGPTKPTGGLLSDVAIDHSGKVYVLLTDLSWTAPGGGAVTTPLYEISTGSWIPQPCAGLPSGPFGSLIVAPGTTDTLYVTSGAQVSEAVAAGGTWTWTPVGAGLPGQDIVDLWIGNVGAPATPKVLLRAAVVTRGVWEADVTTGPATA